VTRPPGGAPPPTQAALTGYAPVDLVELAREICTRYRAEFPDEDGRYGDAGVAWCLHDNQHILNWAIEARNGRVDLVRELDWLARVLEARGFPLERLVRDLEIAADVTREHVPAIADELTAGARFVRATSSPSP
jgi:hypothetical protein